MQQLQIIGHLGDDPRITELEDKKSILVNFNVAVTRNRPNAEKEEDQTQTTWYSCTKRLGEKRGLLEYLKKGTFVFIQGELTAGQRMYKGNVYQDLKVNVAKLRLLSTKKDD